MTGAPGPLLGVLFPLRLMRGREKTRGATSQKVVDKPFCVLLVFGHSPK